MGIVYLAKDRRLKRHVAIKLLPPELAFRSEIRKRFLREAETAAQLSHPNIVPIYAVDESQNLVFFVMAYIDGDNLAQRLQRHGRVSAEETRRILREVGDALDYAHSRKVIHRDIKPDNILLDAETGRAMVTDFGIARAVSEGDSRLTATGMAIGTPAFMSPEQCAGDREIDGRSDLYSLGVVAYHMLTGDLPFTASNTPAMLVKHLSEAPIPVQSKRADIPSDLARAVMLLLEKDPANRFPSAAALTTALERGNVPELPVRLPPGVPSRLSQQSIPAIDDGEYEPTAEEQRRWNAPQVIGFRRKLAFYGFVAPIVFLTSVFSSTDFFFPLTIWTIYMAYQYARIWTDNYDWHDVFRQHRDRELIDVATEGIETVRLMGDALGSPEGRERLRDRMKERKALQRSMQTSSPIPLAASDNGPHAGTLRQAAMDRDEIARLIQSLPRSERDLVSGVTPSANALYDRIQVLINSLADIERNAVPGTVERVDAEITTLESQANPLESRASEERVRRLAYLKRQRRALADIVRRRDQTHAHLESCALALQNMRYDVLRLRAGGQTHQHVTSIAERAMSLAKEVDTAVYVADQLAQSTARGSGARSRPS
jgi:serine/threonine-protein kinase